MAGPASVYDELLDAKYLDPLLRADMGGSYHRLFDGGHTIAGAVRAALPSVAAATAAATPIVGTLNDTLADRSGGANLS